MAKRLSLARMKRILDRIQKQLGVDRPTAAIIAAILTHEDKPEEHEHEHGDDWDDD